MSRKNPFLLFLSACIPGCGQMYQGYMKRGVSIMSTFALIIGLSTWLYFGQLALALPVLWLYSFFDTYNLRRALQNGTAAPDAYPWACPAWIMSSFPVCWLSGTALSAGFW
jgi:TM2 domain-containing membrane protein YozV